MRPITAAALTAAGLLLAGCTSSTAASPSAASNAASSAATAHGQLSVRRAATRAQVGPPGAQASGVLRLGLAENAADAPALLGWQAGYFGRSLGPVTLEPTPYTSAAQEAAALEDGQLDAAYLDPVTAIAAWQAAPAEAIKIISGAVTGGAELIVAPQITSAAMLKGLQIAAPTGGAQQAAADNWLHGNGLPALTQTSGSVGTGLLQEFQSGQIAGAWEPPPLDVQLTDAGGHVLVNEATLWPGGNFPTDVLVVTQQYLTAEPQAVTDLLQGQLQAEQTLTADPASAAAAISQRLTAIGNPLPTDVITQSLAQLTFTSDPLPGPLLTEAQHAAAAGLINPVTDLTSIYDLNPLNQLRTTDHQPTISS
jgi:NitT/TauT family transport system substrate-binding protein